MIRTWEELGMVICEEEPMMMNGMCIGLLLLI